MVIAKSKAADGKEILLLGLSEENMARMKAGKPVVVSERTNIPKGILPPNFEIVIFSGATETAITTMLSEHGMIDKDTKVEVRNAPPKA